MKKLCMIISVVILMTLCAAPAGAQVDQNIYDYSDVLDYSQELMLESRADVITQSYGIDVAVISVSGLGDTTLEQYCDSFAANTLFGTNDTRDGIIFVADTEKNEFIITPTGVCGDIFNPAAVDAMTGNIEGSFYAGSYYDSCDRFLQRVEERMGFYAAGVVSTEHVYDFAGLLTDSEEELLAGQIDELRYSYDVDAVLLTVDSTNGMSAQSYGEDFFDYNGFGSGSDFSGFLLVVNMNEREYRTVTTGYCLTALTDYGIEMMGEAMMPMLRDGDYYDAFSSYFRTASGYLEDAENGEIFDDYGDDEGESAGLSWALKSALGDLFVIIVIAVIISLVNVTSMKGKLKTVRQQNMAQSYIRDGAFTVKNRQDLYLYTTTTRTRVSENSGSSGSRSHHSGGGSSSHSGSSGRSHGGGGGHF